MAISLNDEKLTGLILASMSNVRPEGFLLCDGVAINRTTYSSLFALSPSITSIVTMTIASPCVVTWNSHGLATGQSIQFTTSGALPTFSTVQTVYFIRVINANTFNLYTTLSNAMNTGVTTGIINTTGTQSGIHTALVYYWGNGNGSTTFNIPDGRGVVLRGSGNPISFLDATSYNYILGQKIDDAFQTHTHNVTDVYPFISEPTQTGGNFLSMVSNTSQSNTTTAPTNRASTETRVKSISVNYYIKF